MGESELDMDMEELSSAEDFLEYFGIEYEASVVYVNRLHILQRFHDYIAGIDEMPVDDKDRHELYAGLLNSAYSDFVRSDALTEKVFRVFRMNDPAGIAVPLSDLTKQIRNSATKV